MRKILFSKEEIWVLLRVLFWAIVFMIAHFGFLMSGEQTEWHLLWWGCRLVSAVAVFYTARHLLMKKGSERIQAAGRRLKSLFGGFLVNVFSWIVQLGHKPGAGRLKLKTSGYTDEVTALKKEKKQKTAKRFRFRQWSSMTEEQRVRYLYEKQIWKWQDSGVETDDSHTPNEQLKAAQKKKKADTDSEIIVRGYNWIRYQPDLPENYAKNRLVADTIATRERKNKRKK